MEIGPDFEEEIHPDYKEVRRKILEELSHPETKSRIDLQKITSFMKGQGYADEEIKPVILLKSPEDVQKLEALSTQASEGLKKTIGYYDADLDLVIVTDEHLRSDDEIDSAYQAKVLATEATIVHELFHATSNSRHYKIGAEDRPEISRIGLYNNAHTRNPIGGFLEEGLAENIARKYVESSLTEDMRPHIAEGQPFWQRELALPSTYLSVDNKGNIVMPATAYAGFAVEKLCQSSPDLEGHLLRMRKDPTQVFRVADTLKKIQPNLYQEIARTPYTTEGFSRLAMKIITMLQPKDLAA